MTKTIEQVRAALGLDFLRREIELLEKFEARLSEWLKLTDDELSAEYAALEAALAAYNQTYGTHCQQQTAKGKKKNVQPKKIQIENKAIQPSAEDDFTFESGELASFQTDADVNKLRGLRDSVATIAQAKRAECDFYDRLERELTGVVETIASLQSRIKAGEFEQPEQPQPQPISTQEEIPLRHRAPF